MPTALESLPHFVEPMLARPGAAFDSAQHLFEVKWDGTRAVAYVERGQVRLMNRRRRDIAGRFPELACLAALPSGTVLDGEVVVFKSGKPDFQSLQRREKATARRRIQTLSAELPATYVVFDQLYRRYEPTLDEPLASRRDDARDSVRSCGGTHVVMSEGVVGAGVEYFRQVEAAGLEGVVAKRLDSRYAPGKRTDAWTKIKRHEDVACAVIGFIPSTVERDDFESLVIASADDAGGLRVVGRVGSGFDGPTRDRINDFLRSHVRPVGPPAAPCTYKRGVWVEPGLYCTVRCMERTAAGILRAPVFRGLYGDGC